MTTTTKPPTKAQAESAICAKFARRVLKEFNEKRATWNASLQAIERRIVTGNPLDNLQHMEKIDFDAAMSGYTFTDDNGQRWLLRFSTLRGIAEKELGKEPTLAGLLDAYGRSDK